jgi:predicted KAP-like P-loop ATPase
MIPGLTQGARRYGRVLLAAVPKAEAVKELFSDLSQEERIKSLTAEIAKMPRRIIVALDNLDRMEAKELETVFKILRGAEEFSSVTFLCCFDSRELSRILKSSRRFQNTRVFIEKFFQITVALPPIDRAKLKQLFEDEMSRIKNGTGERQHAG